MIRFIFLFLSFAFVLFEVQGQEANVFLSKLVAKLESVDDYSADVLIKADIPLIKILPSKAKIYFKKPDSCHHHGHCFIKKIGSINDSFVSC